jgi:hypothetical protein
MATRRFQRSRRACVLASPSSVHGELGGVPSLDTTSTSGSATHALRGKTARTALRGQHAPRQLDRHQHRHPSHAFGRVLHRVRAL